jgi:hypothetical protein
MQARIAGTGATVLLNSASRIVSTEIDPERLDAALRDVDREIPRAAANIEHRAMSQGALSR